MKRICSKGGRIGACGGRGEAPLEDEDRGRSGRAWGGIKDMYQVHALEASGRTTPQFTRPSPFRNVGTLKYQSRKHRQQGSKYCAQ